MRILIPSLTPGTAYGIQLRAKDSHGNTSEWSRVFSITTTGDSVAPKTPTGVAGSMSGTTFNLSWNVVTESEDNTPAHDFDHYEVKVESAGTATVGVYSLLDTKFQFTLEANRSLFTSPRANVKMSVRAVDKVGNASPYSAVVDQTNPAPANVTGFSGSAGTDVITFKWNAVADADLMEYRLYSGTTAGSQTSLVWAGNATGAAIQSIEYATDKWFKVAAVDVFGTLSVTPPVVGPLKPNSPFLVDNTAPSTPTGLAATLTNATDGKTAKAAVTWTAVTDTDNDLAEYIIGYKPSAETNWQYSKVDYTNTATTITGLLPYTNYDFRIRASDWSANLSAWSSTLTKTATANTAPAVPTGLTMTAGVDNLMISWTANTEVDMTVGAGVYDVTVATNSGFTTGVLQYRTGANTLTVNGLAVGTQYWARVRAIDSGSLASAYSTSVTATTGNFPVTNNVIIQDAAPGPEYRNVNTLWIDTTLGANTPKRWVSGTTWAVVTDKVATDAAAAVSALSTNLSTNYSTTTQMTTAIQNAANGKNKITYSTSDASGTGFTEGDTWRKVTTLGAGGKIIKEWTFTSGAWQTKVYSGLTLTDLDAGSITTGFLDVANRIQAGSLVIGQINSLQSSLDAAVPKVAPTTLGTGKVYTNPFAVSYSGASLPGSIVIETPINFGNYMTRLTLEGYNYQSGSVDISVDVSFYAYSGTNGVYINYSATSTGACPVTVRLAKKGSDTTAGTVVIIIDRKGGAAWAYPKISVNSAIVSQTNPPDSWVSGWTAPGAPITDLSAYFGLITVPMRDFDDTNTLAQTWRYTGTTEINGGAIRTDTIDVIKLKAGSTFTQDLNVANTFTLGTATLDGLIKSYGYTDAGTSGFKLAKSGLVIKGTGNVVDGATIPTNTIDVNSIKTSTLTATTINLGATGVINVDSTGSIKSNNYALNSTGYKLSNTGLEINDGSIDAKVLKTNTAIIGDLTVGQSGGASGTIKSYDYVAGSAGWKIGKNLFEINNGSIAAAALNIQQGQNIVPPAYADFEFVPSFYNSNLLVSSNATATIMTSGARFNKQYLSLRTNTAAAASVTLGTLTTDYNIPVEAGQTYIVSAWLKTGSVATATYFYPRWSTGVQGSGMYLGVLPANGSWQRISSILTVPAGVTAMNIFVYSSTTTIGAGFDIDGVQVEIKEGALNSPSTWTPPSMTSVDGGIIRTGEIRSNTNVTVNSVSQPAWSINMSGNAQFGDALVRGKMLVGQSGADVDAGQSYIASGNYVANTTGWKIDSSGNTEFNSGMYRGLLGAKVVKAGNIDVGAIDAENIKLGVFNKNLVRDPSFEETYSIDTASTSNYDKWRIIDQTVGTGGAVAAVRYASPRSGAWALKLATSTVGSPTNQIQVYSPNIAVTPGQTYVLSINAAKLGSATVRFYVRIAGGSTQDLTEYPASSPGTQIPFSGEDGATFLENQDLTNAGDPADPNAFDNFTGQFTVPAGVNWVAVRVFNWCPSTGTAFVVDDVSVIPLGTGATELTSAGLRLFGPDGTEVASFVANRPNYFTVIKDGVNVATVDDSGDAAFNNGRFSGDLSVGGAPLIGPAYEDYSPGQNSPISPLSVIEQMPWGLVQWGGKYSNSGATNTTTGIGVMEIAVQILRGRMYKLCTSPLRVRSSVAGDAVEVRVHVEYGTYLNEDSFPAQPQVTSTQLCRVPISTIDNVQGEAITLNKLVQWGFADGDTITHAYNARLLLTVARVAGTGNVFVNGSSDDPIEFWLEDIGPARNSGGSDNDGGGGVIYQPAPKKTYVKTFRSTSAATYKGSGAKRTDTTDVVQGYDSYNGNGKGLWIFPTMTGYIGGSAVINKIEIYAYANHWYYNSGGTARIYAHNYSGAPGSSPSMSYVTQSTGWPKPGGRWVTLPNVGGLYNSFHDGTLKGFGMGPGPSTSKTYYGRFNGGTAALIRVTYTK